MRIKVTLLVAMIFLALSASFGQLFAQPTEASYTVNLNSFTLQVTYPSEVLPGENVTINLQATPKTSTYLVALLAMVYYADSAGLHLVGTQTLVSNTKYAYGSYGVTPTGAFSTSFTVAVPQGAPRTSLIAVFSETVQSNNYNYYDYNDYDYVFGCSDPIFCVSYYPSYSYNTGTDDAVSPLSYIKATTPETVALQFQSQLLGQRLNETQAQNQQLQLTVSQNNATISALRQQLAAASSVTQTYQAVAFGAIIVAIVIAVAAVFLMLRKRTEGRYDKTGEEVEPPSSP
jgi:hypothetical protein